MLQFQIKRDAETVREWLRQLIATSERTKGSIVGDTFWLRTSGRRDFPITLHGNLRTEGEGTLISAWPTPPWLMIVVIPIYCWFCLRWVSAPIWWIVLGLFISVLDFAMGVRAAYNLLRSIDMEFQDRGKSNDWVVKI